MKVLRIMIGLLIISSNISIYAQKNNVQNAYRAFEKKNMQEAVEYIELAAANSKTANDEIRVEAERRLKRNSGD